MVGEGDRAFLGSTYTGLGVEGLRRKGEGFCIASEHGFGSVVKVLILVSDMR